MTEDYRFRELEIYRLALEYLDAIWNLAEKLPTDHTGKLADRLADSVSHLVVQIASKATGASEIERAFMIDGTLMSLYETAACLDIIERRKLIPASRLKEARTAGLVLHDTLQKMKKALRHR